MLEIGINMYCYGHGMDDLDEQIVLMKKYGFNHTFTGSDAKNLDEIMTKLNAAGIKCDNYHAPFDGINNIWLEDEAGEEMLARLIEAVDNCARYNVPVLVVHLSSGTNAPRINDIGYQRWQRLMDHANEKGIKIAYENQRKLANLAFAMEQFPEAGFCWDTGHEECFAGGLRFMPLFGKRLVALHIHDNFKKFNGDKHMLPYDAAIDFDYVAKEIAQSGFEGTVMLELIRSANIEYYESVSIEDYYARAAAAAKKIAERVDFFKSQMK